MAIEEVWPARCDGGRQDQYVADQPRHEPGHARGTHRRYLSTGAEIRARRQPGWRQPVVADRLRAGCFGRRIVRIFPGWISRLEFADPLARRAGRVARFSRPMRERPVRACAFASRSWLKASPDRTPGAKATVALFKDCRSWSAAEVSLARIVFRRKTSGNLVLPCNPVARRQPVARIASRSGGLLPGMNSPIQSRRVASICQDIASAE